MALKFNLAKQLLVWSTKFEMKLSRIHYAHPSSQLEIIVVSTGTSAKHCWIRWRSFVPFQFNLWLSRPELQIQIAWSTSVDLQDERCRDRSGSIGTTIVAYSCHANPVVLVVLVCLGELVLNLHRRWFVSSVPLCPAIVVTQAHNDGWL